MKFHPVLVTRPSITKPRPTVSQRNDTRWNDDDDGNDWLWRNKEDSRGFLPRNGGSRGDRCMWWCKKQIISDCIVKFGGAHDGVAHLIQFFTDFFYPCCNWKRLGCKAACRSVSLHFGVIFSRHLWRVTNTQKQATTTKAKLEIVATPSMARVPSSKGSDCCCWMHHRRRIVRLPRWNFPWMNGFHWEKTNNGRK